MAGKQDVTTRSDTGDLLSVGKAAKALGTSRWSVYRWIEQKKIISVFLGGFTFIPRSEIERLQNKKAEG